MLTHSSSNRRGGRGRYTDARPRSFYVLPPERDPDIAVDMKQPGLQIWKAPQASPTAWHGVRPRDLTPIASYNWTSNRKPTIIVPGIPLANTIILFADSGVECRRLPSDLAK